MNIQAKTQIARALRVTEISPDLDNLRISVVDAPIPRPGPGQVLVEIISAAVNPSDVKAALGHMPQAIWPRTPGRDFAGIVREGPAHLVDLEIWGSGGELGISRDGSHARWMVLDQHAVRRKPAALSMDEASAIGVPFVTASEGFREAGGAKPTDVVLVLGANGKVGQAAIQMATMSGSRVFAVQRTGTEPVGHANGPVDVIPADHDIAAIVRDRTGGHGADIVFNTVGSPYFEAGNKAMAKDARHILISTLERAVPFDIFPFFRGRHKFLGIDSLGLTSTEGGRILDVLRPKFEDGRLRPFPINPDFCFHLHDAAPAYASVLRGNPERVILKPQG